MKKKKKKRIQIHTSYLTVNKLMRALFAHVLVPNRFDVLGC